MRIGRLGDELTDMYGDTSGGGSTTTLNTPWSGSAAPGASTTVLNTPWSAAWAPAQVPTTGLPVTSSSPVVSATAWLAKNSTAVYVLAGMLLLFAVINRPGRR